MEDERRFCEFRVAGRTLTGRAMTYGDVSPSLGERFLPGAFGADIQAPDLNLQHDSNMVLLESGAYVLTDGPRSLEVRADLPEGSAALQLVKRGALRGFSIEFRAVVERKVNGIREIVQAELRGLALVDKPAYPTATAEVRCASNGLLRVWL